MEASIQLGGDRIRISKMESQQNSVVKRYVILKIYELCIEMNCNKFAVLA